MNFFFTGWQKYFTLAFFHVGLLLLLLAGGSDNVYIRTHAFHPVPDVILTFLSVLITLSVTPLVELIAFKTLKPDSSSRRLLVNLITLVILNSGFYFVYGKHFFQVITSESRYTLGLKIETHNPGFQINSADLTWKEYQILGQMIPIKPLPPSASHISYAWYSELLLPDYSFIITYQLPAEVPAEEFDIRKGDYIRRQSVTSIGTVKFVRFEEIQM